MAISALGIAMHQLWLMWLGSGVIGGIGLGLGYISPVSTLIKWFPDRRGMATGMAIMGFGGGAMIGSPLADMLMNAYRTPTSVGVWQTFLTLAAIYFVFMMAGALGYRVPPAGWQPQGWTPPASKAMIADGHVHLRDAHKTLQFWLLWAVLCLNVSASIGIIGVAAPMLQEVFGGTLIGQPDVGFLQFDDEQKRAAATIAAGFVGLISLFNIGGRFFWASLSDKLGRKTTYVLFFVLGAALYIAVPSLAAAHALALYVLAFCIIASMYGGGFATIPAYLADIFGTQFVGAIHGRLLTAWSTAGIIGPLIVAYMRDAEIAAGVSRPHIYDRITVVLAAMLAVGFVANLLVRPLAARWFMKDVEHGASPGKSQPSAAAAENTTGIGRGGLDATALLTWLAVGIPIAWGVWITLSKALVLLG
jgi:MFS family permease